MENTERTEYLLAALHLIIGFMFFFAFLDKVFGLGFPTNADNAYIRGGSPTHDFLAYVNGPFKWLFQSLADISAVTDVLLLIGMFCIGLALLLGIASRITTIATIVLTFIMYLSVLPVSDNPFLDYHIVYIFVIAAAYFGNGFCRLSLKSRWDALPVVKDYKILQ